MKKALLLLLLSSLCMMGAENLITNPKMAEKNAQGVPVAWSLSRKGIVQAPGADGADFTLGIADDQDATMTHPVALAPNVPYVFSFDAKSDDGGLMNCYYEWFSRKDGKNVYGGGSAVKKQVAPTEWKHFETSVMVTDSFHHGYVAMRSLNGKAISFRNVSFVESRREADKGTGGFWSLDFLKERYTAKGVVVRNGQSATLHAIPVEAGRHYALSYLACGQGTVDAAYPFHEIITKIKPAVQCAIMKNDVTNSPQRKTLKFKVPVGSGISRISVDFSCVTRKSDASVLFSDFSVETIEPDPRDSWRFELLQPGYRDTIYANQALEVMECQVLTDGKPAYCIVSFNGQDYRQAVNGETDARVKVPVAGLADGKYPLECKVCNEDGVVMKSFTKNLLKVPAALNEVTAGPDRFLRINGKPFLMNYVNLREWSEDYVYYAARHGVNTAILQPGKMTEAEIISRLDLADKYGIKVLFYTGWADGKLLSADAFRKNLERRFTVAMRRHPAFLMYCTVDEPMWRGLAAEQFKVTYEILREFDPYHPVWINAAPRGEVEDLRAYGEACDIWGCDIYPVPAPNSHSGLDDKMMTSVGKYAARMNDVTYWRKPILMCLQGFGWGENPENGPRGRAKIHPKKEEMRFMLFDAMVNGTTCVEFWGSHHVKNADFLELVFDTSFVLHGFSGLFLNGRQVKDAETSDKAIRASVWECQGQRWYFIMNTSNAAVESMVDVTEKSVTEVTSWGAKILVSPTEKMRVSMKPYGYLVCGTAQLPRPAFALVDQNPEFEAKGSPVAKTIQKVLDSFEGTTKFKTTAKWIWQAQETQVNGNVCFIAKAFKVAKGEKATLKLAVDDASTVFLNGVEVGKTTGWSNLFTFDMTDKVREGDNVLVIRAEDLGALPCGVLAELKVGNTVMLSDESWLGLPAENASVPVPASLEQFKPSTVITPYGGGAWRDNVMMKVAK